MSSKYRDKLCYVIAAVISSKLRSRCPPESNWVFLLSKSFWPHYHYLIPNDYKSGEYGTYDAGCTSAFIRVWAALGIASDLNTVETATVQKALADATRSKKSMQACLDDAISKQTLPKDHYLCRG